MCMGVQVRLQVLLEPRFSKRGFVFSTILFACLGTLLTKPWRDSIPITLSFPFDYLVLAYTPPDGGSLG